MARVRNRCEFCGNVGRTPVLKQKGSTKYTRLGIAVDKPARNADGSWGKSTIWVYITAFDTMAEKLVENARTGALIWVTTTFRPEIYKTEDGSEREGFSFVVDDFDVLRRGSRDVTDDLTKEADLLDDSEEEEDYVTSAGNSDMPF